MGDWVCDVMRINVFVRILLYALVGMVAIGLDTGPTHFICVNQQTGACKVDWLASWRHLLVVVVIYSCLLALCVDVLITVWGWCHKRWGLKMTKTKILLLVGGLLLLVVLGYERRVYVCLEDGMLVNEYRLCGVTIQREEEATAVSEMVGDGTCAHEESAWEIALSFRLYSGGVSRNITGATCRIGCGCWR